MMKAETANNIVSYLLKNQSRLDHLLRSLVLMESPSRIPTSQKPILKLLQQYLSDLDYCTFAMPGKKTGGFLFARPLQRPRKKPLQLLIGHCDTVWRKGTLQTMPLVEEDGKLKGPGVYDMKAGLTQIFFALETIDKLKLQTKLTPVILINSDEEIGSRESTPIIRRLAKIADRAFILEPPLGLDGKLKTARKGLGRFTLTVKGKAAHAGLDPSKGVSAIIELSHQIQKLFAMNDPKKGISVNVGMIEGGVRANVVAPESKAIVDVRVLHYEDGNRITEMIHSLQPTLPGTEIHVEGRMGRPPMERTPANQKLWALAKSSGQLIGLDLEQATAGGGSDGNTTSLFTATLDGLGTTGDGAHAAHEYIFLDKLIERTALLTLLLIQE